MDVLTLTLVLILCATTLIDVVPMVYESRLSEYQKYAWVFYTIATIVLLLEGRGASAFFWMLSAIISYIWGDGKHETTYLALFALLCIVWALFIFVFGTAKLISSN